MMRRYQRTADGVLSATSQLSSDVLSISHPLRLPSDLDPLLEHIGDATYVLLGEASHGTHEYYAWRDALSRRLIQEKGFSFIAVEGDWPDCYRVNRFVKRYPDSSQSARDVLHNFERWPTWMWANEEILTLVEWLRRHNEGRPEENKVGFYGLDVYSLWDSLYQVLGYLATHAPSQMSAARRAFQCFEPYGEDVHDYARATRWVDESCEDEVVAMLSELRGVLREDPRDGQGPATWAGNSREEGFNAEQNSFVVKNAEHYYRTMVHGGADSWNIRDRHMVETLERLMQHHGPGAKAIVWEHNTHIGDARYTDMAAEGMVNVGQLVREEHGDEGTVLIGFGSYQGTVIAGSTWEAPMQRMEVPPAQPGSWEDVLHRADASDRLLMLHGVREHEGFLQERGHRAIGVVYRPDHERFGNYVPTVLPYRYDAFLFLDRTRALRPLREVQPRREGEVPETYPSGA